MFSPSRKLGRKHKLTHKQVLVTDITLAVRYLHVHSETHTCLVIHTLNDSLWPHLSPCNTVTLWSCVRLLLGNCHFPCGRHSSGCYLQRCCSAAVSRLNSPLFFCVTTHYCFADCKLHLFCTCDKVCLLEDI